jgi:hypothetical protein
MYLFLALIWLSLGVVMLLLPWLEPLGFPAPAGKWGPMAGWIALLSLMFCVYNLVRWWNARSYAAAQRAALLERERREEERPARPFQPPDPNFDFSDRPPT